MNLMMRVKKEYEKAGFRSGQIISSWAPKSLQMVIADMKLKDACLSMCRVFSCVVGRGCLLLPAHSLGSEVKASACNAGDLGSIPGSGGSPGEGNGNPLQYFCLENITDRGAW